MSWLSQFRSETACIIPDPFFLCLAESIAIVESARGTRAIVSSEGINEIGYKAISGKPAINIKTHEANPDGSLSATETGFRLFANRMEQASALAWLLQASSYYESARLLFVLAFYSAYAPGRIDGIRELLRVFNQQATSPPHKDRVRPFHLFNPTEMDLATRNINHTAARTAVRLFGELTSS